MTQSLATVRLFLDNADAYAAFLARLEAVIVDKAIDLLSETSPSPVTPEWAARQNWAVGVLLGPPAIAARAKAMLPTLVVKANDAGLIDGEGNINVTDTQIRDTIDDEFIDLYAGYVWEVE
jgi:hypothetical protein